MKRSIHTKTPLAKEHRLRTRQQLDYVRRHGTSKAGRYCVVAMIPAPDGQRRWVAITSKKYSPKAVVRNRARRLFREAWRQLFPAIGDVWVVFIPRWHMKEAGFDDLMQELQRLCTELELFTEAVCTDCLEAGQ